MLANLTDALKTKGMWNNTILFFLGDNGAPTANAGSNSEHKGAKFTHWEGGHRVASFIGGPLVTPALRGQWYNQTVHLVDLHATILDLAGVQAALHPPGTMPVDGFSLVPVLNLTRAIDSDIRPNNGELWITDDVYVQCAFIRTHASFFLDSFFPLLSSSSSSSSSSPSPSPSPSSLLIYYLYI